MEISIIIVNWNTRELLINCLESIIASRPKIDYEIIVVDNGSTDGSVEALAKFKKRVGLKIIKNKTNLGFAVANNVGIRISRGKYKLLLNSDTKVKNRALDNLIDFAEATPDAGVVGARLYNADGSIQTSCFKFPTIIGAIRQYWFGVSGLLNAFYPNTVKPVAVDVVVGAAMLITPKARQKAGLLNEKYFFFFEDFDYCRKIKSVGLKAYYMPTAEVIHYHGSTVRKVADADQAWKKLIPGSKIYHGLIGHYLIWFIMWTSQKWQKLF